MLNFVKGRKEAYCTVPTISFKMLVQHIRLSLQQLMHENTKVSITNTHEVGLAPIISATKVI